MKPKVFGQSERHKRESRQAYDKARGTAHQRGPYNHPAWAATRRRVATRDLYQCQECKRIVGIAKGDYHCDHIKERPVGHPYDPMGWDNDENLQTLCPGCHSRKTGGRKHWHKVRPIVSRRFVVCGPPGSGKTTYVREHALAGETVWDWDVVRIATYGDIELSVSQRTAMLKRRDAVAWSLMESSEPVWLIVTDKQRAAKIAEQIGARVVTMTTSKEECVRRVRQRDGVVSDAQMAAIQGW